MTRNNLDAVELFRLVALGENTGSQFFDDPQPSTVSLEKAYLGVSVIFSSWLAASSNPLAIARASCGSAAASCFNT